VFACAVEDASARVFALAGTFALAGVVIASAVGAAAPVIAAAAAVVASSAGTSSAAHAAVAVHKVAVGAGFGVAGVHEGIGHAAAAVGASGQTGFPADAASHPPKPCWPEPVFAAVGKRAGSVPC